MTLAATRDVSVVTAPVAVSNDEPASHASTASMAYSGRTAIRASTAIANEADTSNSATSAAQESRKAPSDDAQSKDRRRDDWIDVKTRKTYYGPRNSQEQEHCDGRPQSWPIEPLSQF